MFLKYHTAHQRNSQMCFLCVFPNESGTVALHSKCRFVQVCKKMLHQAHSSSTDNDSAGEFGDDTDVGSCPEGCVVVMVNAEPNAAAATADMSTIGYAGPDGFPLGSIDKGMHIW